MRFGWLVAGAALSFCIVAGCSQSAARHDTPDDGPKTGSTQQAIQNGAADGTDHPFVVGVCAAGNGPGNPGSCQGYCTGTLILPNLVVTARHCVNQTPKNPNGTAANIDCTTNPTYGASENVQWITTNNIMFQSSVGWHHVQQIVTPTDDHICGHDIALLILDDVIDGAEAKPAIPGVQYPMSDLNRYVRRFTAVGYGLTSAVDPPPSARCFTSQSDPTICPGVRRIKQTIPVFCIPGDDIAPCAPDPQLMPSEFRGGDGTCSGDSGSSAFDDSLWLKNTPVSFGVLSRGSESGTACVASFYSRLDAWRDLIVQTATTASASWTLYPKPIPDWTIYVPPPPDAGAPEAGPKKPSPLGIACNVNADCASNVCFDTGGGKECTNACDGSVVPTTCQDGYICTNAVCVQDLGGNAAPVAAAPATTTTHSGCSLALPAGLPGDSPWGILGLSAAAGLVLARRRARASRAERPTKSD